MDKVVSELIKIAKLIALSKQEEAENWIRDLTQVRGKAGISEADLLKAGKTKFGKTLLKKVLRELKKEKYIAKKSGNWVWIEAM